MPTDWIAALVGGILIGLASLSLMAFHGRIAGISGITGALLDRTAGGESGWRIAFLAGLVGSGVILSQSAPALYPTELPRSLPLLVVAGLLVGFGTRLGSGCTSGHGVCGLSRLSARSMAATGVFMAAGMVTVAVYRMITGGAV